MEPGAGLETQEIWVFVHGAAGSPAALQGLAREFADDRRRIVIPALAGYGGTKAPEGMGPLAANEEIISLILQTAPEGRHVLVGHSMGGFIALKAVQNTALVDALVAIEPMAFGALDPRDAGDAAALTWDRAVNAGLLNGDPAQGLPEFIQAWNDVSWDDLPERARHALEIRAPHLANEIAAVSADKTPAKDYVSIDAPVLFLRGDASPEAAHRIIARLSRAIPNSETVSIEGVGHFGCMEQPREFAVAVHAFLHNKLT
ncbi:MAG: alpha/beta fold hydrolase [Alphaproteobacteria bacterium]